MVDKTEEEKKITKAQKLEALIALAPPVSEEVTYTYSIFSQCCLPVNRPKSDRWVVKHGKVGIGIVAGFGKDLEVLQVPYGSYARLALTHIHNQIVRAGSIDTACYIELGDSMRAFFRENGLEIGGKQGKSLQQQLLNIANARITITQFTDNRSRIVNVPTIASQIDLWLESDENQKTIWQSEMIVNREYAELVRNRAVPLDLRARLGLMKDSPRGAARAMDVYDWLTYRLPSVRDRKGIFVPFEGINGLHNIFGLEIKAAKKFKQQFLESLKLAAKYYPDARVTLEEKGVHLFCSPPAVPYGSSKPMYLRDLKSEIETIKTAVHKPCIKGV